MPSKKSKSPQGDKQNYRVWRKQLKEIGLFGKRTSLRAKVSPAQKRQIEKYKSVVTGGAKAFTMPAKDAKKLRKLYGLKGSGEAVIVPKKKGERITFSKKSSEITIKRRGRKTVYSPDLSKRAIPPGKRLFYTLEFQRGNDTERYRWEVHEDMVAFMQPYEVKPRNAWKNWRSYVVLDYLDKEEITDARGEGDVINTKRKPKSAKFVGIPKSDSTAARGNKARSKAAKRNSGKTGKTTKRGTAKRKK